MELSQQILLSIILPCYKVEKYIGECLNSLYDQNISENTYEVICVNDLSPDKTREIIIEYQKEHRNLVLIDHESNKKQGAARNTGLNIAKGQYIWFIDSDDWIESNCFFELLSILSKDNLDILNFNYYTEEPDKSYSNKYDYETTNLISGKEFCREHLKFWENGGPCRRIFNRHFLISSGIIFPETGYMEDTIFTTRTIYYSKRFRHLNKSYYYYRWNENSTTKSKFDDDKALAVFHAISELLLLSDEIERNDPFFSNILVDYAMYNLYVSAKWIIYTKHSNRKNIKLTITNNLIEISKNSYMHGWRSLLFSNFSLAMYILAVFSPFLYNARRIKRYIFNKHS